jgi:two-component system, cell cycle sensor histidine kinase and response regulator CckA
MTVTDSAGAPSSVSVVLAENDKLVSEVMGELLRSKGYDVHIARDGLEALHLIKTIRPALVILDVVMPKLDGSRVCWLVRQDPVLRDTPIIVFSSLAARDFRHFPDLSADAYVAKGPATDAFENILKAIEHVRTAGRADIASGIFGYDEVRPREVVGELVDELRHVASVLKALGPGTMEIDREGRILRVSMGACEILGKNESQLIGEPLTSLCPLSDRDTLRNLVEELGQADQPERCRTVVRFGDLEVPVQLCPIVERDRCSGVFLIMESRGVPVAASPR